jgi:hypothetical protein
MFTLLGFGLLFGVSVWVLNKAWKWLMKLLGKKNYTTMIDEIDRGRKLSEQDVEIVRLFATVTAFTKFVCFGGFVIWLVWLMRGNVLGEGLVAVYGAISLFFLYKCVSGLLLFYRAVRLWGLRGCFLPGLEKLYVLVKGKG